MKDKICPWCGIKEEADVFSANGQIRIYWKCGSWKQGKRQFQTDRCRVRELEAENESLQIRAAAVAAGAIQPETEDI